MNKIHRHFDELLNVYCHNEGRRCNRHCNNLHIYAYDNGERFNAVHFTSLTKNELMPSARFMKTHVVVCIVSTHRQANCVKPHKAVSTLVDGDSPSALAVRREGTTPPRPLAVVNITFL